MRGRPVSSAGKSLALHKDFTAWLTAAGLIRWPGVSVGCVARSEPAYRRPGSSKGERGRGCNWQVASEEATLAAFEK